MTERTVSQQSLTVDSLGLGAVILSTQSGELWSQPLAGRNGTFSLGLAGDTATSLGVPIVPGLYLGAFERCPHLGFRFHCSGMLPGHGPRVSFRCCQGWEPTQMVLIQDS